MRIIEPYFEFIDQIDGQAILKKIERCGRVAHKSEDKITEDSARKFVTKLIEWGHESVLEHANITVLLVCDRGVTHELVRHRIGSYTQESTRYCDYQKAGEITVIKPLFFQEGAEQCEVWKNTMRKAEVAYRMLRNLGAKPEQARSVLPNSLKTEIVVTFNLREWRHVFKLRCAKAAHPQMRQIMIPLLKEFQKKIPVIYDDFVIDEEQMTAVK